MAESPILYFFGTLYEKNNFCYFATVLVVWMY